jgi:hypothetical protein
MDQALTVSGCAVNVAVERPPKNDESRGLFAHTESAAQKIFLRKVFLDLIKFLLRNCRSKIFIQITSTSAMAKQSHSVTFRWLIMTAGGLSVLSANQDRLIRDA